MCDDHGVRAGPVVTSPISALLFDFGGTLDADGVTWKERVFRLYRREGVVVAREAFDRLFYRADDALVGAIPATLSFRDTVGRLIEAVTDGVKPGDEALTHRVATRFIADALAHLRDNGPVLARLGRRYRLGIVSNFYGNLARVCEDAGIRPFFGAIVDSTRVGCRKPDPAIFAHALAALGVGPADATFVGDSLSRDMAGARAVGMAHVWLAGEAASDTRLCCPGDRTIRSLGELEGELR